MEEQNNSQEVKKCGSCGARNAKSAVKIIIGLVLITLGVWAIIAWFSSFLAVVKGCLGLFLFLAGVVVIILARE